MRIVSEVTPLRPVLSVARRNTSAPGSDDANYRAVMGLKARVTDQRKIIRALVVDLNDARRAVRVLTRAWLLISNEQRKRMEAAGVATPEEILRVASGLGVTAFADWFSQLCADVARPEPVAADSLGTTSGVLGSSVWSGGARKSGDER